MQCLLQLSGDTVNHRFRWELLGAYADEMKEMKIKKMNNLRKNRQQFIFFSLSRHTEKQTRPKNIIKTEFFDNR